MWVPGTLCTINTILWYTTQTLHYYYWVHQCIVTELLRVENFTSYRRKVIFYCSVR